MAKIIWTKPAVSDLQTIAEYIELDKPAAARKLVQTIFSTVEKLKEFPKIGKISKEDGLEIYRELLISPCRIFYRVEKNIVYIVAVVRMEKAIIEIYKMSL